MLSLILKLVLYKLKLLTHIPLETELANTALLKEKLRPLDTLTLLPTHHLNYWLLLQLDQFQLLLKPKLQFSNHTDQESSNQLDVALNSIMESSSLDMELMPPLETTGFLRTLGELVGEKKDSLELQDQLLLVQVSVDFKNKLHTLKFDYDKSYQEY